jgi:hypothetical protein
MRLRAKHMEVADPGPIVRDQQGVPVGVHVDDRGVVDESALARRLRRLNGLRKTHELDGQYRLRCQVSLFCSDPPR